MEKRGRVQTFENDSNDDSNWKWSKAEVNEVNENHIQQELNGSLYLENICSSVQHRLYPHLRLKILRLKYTKIEA